MILTQRQQCQIERQFIHWLLCDMVERELLLPSAIRDNVKIMGRSEYLTPRYPTLSHFNVFPSHDNLRWEGPNGTKHSGDWISLLSAIKKISETETLEWAIGTYNTSLSQINGDKLALCSPKETFCPSNFVVNGKNFQLIDWLPTTPCTKQQYGALARYSCQCSPDMLTLPFYGRLWSRKYPITMLGLVNETTQLYNGVEIEDNSNAQIILTEDLDLAIALNKLIADSAFLNKHEWVATSWYGGHALFENLNLYCLQDRKVIFLSEAPCHATTLKSYKKTLNKAGPESLLYSEVLFTPPAEQHDTIPFFDLRSTESALIMHAIQQHCIPFGKAKGKCSYNNAGSTIATFGKSLDEILSEPTEHRDGTPVRLNELIQPNNLTVIYGATETGKTFVAQSIALALASGNALWNFAGGTRRNVVYFDAESSLEALQNRIQRLQHIVGNETSRINFYHKSDCIELGVDLRENEARKKLLDVIPEKSVVVFDNLLSLSGKEITHGNSWNNLQEFFNKLATRKVSVILIHHEGKNGTAKGSSNITSLAQVVMHLTKSEQTDDSGIAIRVEFEKCKTPGTLSGESFDAMLSKSDTSSWKVTNSSPVLSTSTPTPNEVEMPNMRGLTLDEQTIINQAITHGAHFSRKDAEIWLNKKSSSTNNILNSLCDNGMLEKLGTGKATKYKPVQNQ